VAVGGTGVAVGTRGEGEGAGLVPDKELQAEKLKAKIKVINRIRTLREWKDILQIIPTKTPHPFSLSQWGRD